MSASPSTSAAADANATLELINYDAVVFDLGLPDRDGLTVLATARRIGKTLPILILTARDAVEDRVAGPQRRGRRLSDKAVRDERADRPD